MDVTFGSSGSCVNGVDPAKTSHARLRLTPHSSSPSRLRLLLAIVERDRVFENQRIRRYACQRDCEKGIALSRVQGRRNMRAQSCLNEVTTTRRHDVGEDVLVMLSRQSRAAPRGSAVHTRELAYCGCIRLHLDASSRRASRSSR